MIQKPPVSEPSNPTAPAPLEDPLKVDASAIAPFQHDLPAAGRKGFKSEQPGLAHVLDELRRNQDNGWNERIGVTEEDLRVIFESTERIGLCDPLLRQAEKLVDLIGDTRAYEDNRREEKLNTIGRKVELAFKDTKDPQTLAAFSAADTYRKQAAKKAAATKKKNKEQQTNNP